MANNEVEIVVRATDKSADGVASVNKNVKGLGKNVDDLAGRQRDAGKDSQEYGKGLGAAGEAADGAEARIIGVKDTIDGAAAVMRGPGADGIGAYLQGWADLASGLASAVIPALQSLSLANIKSTASTVASTVAQKTAAAATKTWAAMQWVMNAALTANPIGLVVVAIAALVAGIIVAYKKSETFRNIVQAAGRAAARAFGWVLEKVQDLIGWVRANWPKLLSILTGPIGLAARLITEKFGDVMGTVQGIPGRIRKAVGGVYSALTGPFRSAVRAIQSWIGGLADRFAGVVASIQDKLSFLPGFAHGGVVGAAAAGGPRSRRTLVGEHGPEIVDLAPGSMVHSNPDSMRMLGGGGAGGGVTVVELIIGGRALGRLIIDPLRGEIRTQGGDVQAVLGSG